MGTLGEDLRAAREKKGVTLKQISEKTRISASFLQALEEENYSLIPGDVFVTGFLRSYAKELGLDEDEVLARFRETRTPPPSPEAKAEEPQHRPKPSLLRIRRGGDNGKPFPIYAVIVGGLVLGVIITGVTMLITGREEAPQAPPPEPPAAMAPATTVMKPTTSFAPATSFKPATTAAPRAEEKETTAKGPLHLKLTASEHSWYSYRADGGTREQGILEKGRTIAVEADERIVLDIGNAGGVTVELNGKKLKPFGEKGEPAKNLVFIAKKP